MKTLKELGERWLVKYVNSTLKRFPETTLPIGDDAVDILSPARLVVSVDMMVQSTDIPEGMNWRDVGYRAVTSSTSDIAAKGGRPRAYLISLALPPDMVDEEFKELWTGILEAAELYGGYVVGGDTNAGDQVIIDVVCIGEASERLIPRDGAKPRDIVAVTGLFGVEAAGLHALMKKVRKEISRRVIEKMVRPVARVKEGLALSKIASASIDSSDGLAESLYLLAESSNVGFKIDKPPVDPLAEEYSRECGVDLIDLVFYGGEEYELVLTISPDKWDLACEEVERVGGRLIEIGYVIDNPRVIEVFWNNEYIELPRKGYTHFSDHDLSR
ncbi:MAG: thiamine-phosphate kinase [Aigarchaeota archaeon]|nr:thiamine-phosphate kinase [Aigarchaeota archaeon]MCX8192689.1 thiamine-phosphate kinase [Nitrososphaeria archaeon]MDW7987011.1 thiamine-phosphate kinase [Nitrososphaerota archaeon]